MVVIFLVVIFLVGIIQLHLHLHHLHDRYRRRPREGVRRESHAAEENHGQDRVEIGEAAVPLGEDAMLVLPQLCEVGEQVRRDGLRRVVQDLW